MTEMVSPGPGSYGYRKLTDLVEQTADQQRIIRTVFLLYYYAGMDVGRIAQLLNDERTKKASDGKR